MVRSPCIDGNGMKKGAWSKEEDNKLKAYVNRYGHWNWRELPKYAGLSRCGKSCRLRWLNYLQPNVKRGSTYTKEEEDIIMKLHDQHGNKWSFIAKQLPGRTDNSIKNYWHTHLKKRTKLIQNPILTSSKEIGESSTDTCQFEGNQENSCNQSSYGQILKEKISEEIERESSSSCSELSLSYSDALLSDILTWVGEDSFACFESSANFWSQPLADPGFLYPPSPIIEDEFLWSDHLGDDSNNW